MMRLRARHIACLTLRGLLYGLRGNALWLCAVCERAECRVEAAWRNDRGVAVPHRLGSLSHRSCAWGWVLR